MSARHDPAKDFLQSAKWARVKARRLELKVAELETQVEHITASYSGMPGGGGSDVASAWTALAALHSEYLEQKVLAEKREKEVSDFIESLPTPEYREILQLRYCQLFGWPKVIKVLESAGIYYSDRQVFRLHGKALNEARIAWAEMEGEIHEETRDT